MHEVAQAPLGEVLVGAVLALNLAQVEDDVGTMVVLAVALARASRGNRVALDAVALPNKGLVRAIGAADDAHVVGHHEGGVEAHAKLADDVDVLALMLGVGLLEGLAARMGDGAQVAVELFLGHADAVVAHGDGACVLVKRQANGQLIGAKLHVRVGQCHKRQLVDGVRGVGDELAQEDLAVGIDGVDHEIKELFALGFELLHGGSFL